VSANGQPLTTAGVAPSVKSSAWRVEYDYGNVSERYDVRADGVEQSFVIAHRPASPGAIEVRARIETELVAAPASGHVAIDFCDAEGNPLVRYGEAFAIDAAGRKVAVTSTFDGGRIVLTVPAAFAESAIYPLTIDPLTTALQVTTGSGVVEDVAVGSCPNATSRNTLVALTRYSSVSDLDLFVVSCSDDWTMSLVVYSDIDAQWSSANPSVGACEGASRWVVAFPA
jgi:hypothetical protein